jgi:hypothetical protein
MYEHLIGKDCVLEVRLGDVMVPIKGIILGESDDVVYFQIAEGWDVDVYKSMITRAQEEK